MSGIIRPASHPIHRLPKPELSKDSLENFRVHSNKPRKDGLSKTGEATEPKVSHNFVFESPYMSVYFCHYDLIY